VGDDGGIGELTRLCRLEGRGDIAARLDPPKTKGLAGWEVVGTGMRLGVVRVTGDRGAAKLAGSRVARLGDPACDIRREARPRGSELGVPPPSLETGTLMRRPELAAVCA
jgi:hypothetical protein